MVKDPVMCHRFFSIGLSDSDICVVAWISARKEGYVWALFRLGFQMCCSAFIQFAYGEFVCVFARHY